MLPFSIELRPGLPLAEQVVFAVKKAVVSGQLQVGDKFPSVRQLSQELRINPNTAHKVVAALVSENVLISTPAVGTIVAAPVAGSRRERSALLGAELERIIVEAKKFGFSLADVQAAVTDHWRKLSEPSKS